jgi:hypothetical protein
MTSVTTPSAADILVELDLRGIQVSVRGDYFGLRPKGKAPDWLKEVMRQIRAELAELLADPRRRWREQAEALVAMHPDEDREDLLHLFDEREAIAALDGGLSDQDAGRLAYQTLQAGMKERETWKP